jgi:hypothetical protein
MYENYLYSLKEKNNKEIDAIVTEELVWISDDTRTKDEIMERLKQTTEKVSPLMKEEPSENVSEEKNGPVVEEVD